MLLKNYMASQKNKDLNLHKIFLNLAFEKAKINLGKTMSNPSVGCVVVKDRSVISSGNTSIGGRPHAEFNALNYNKNFNGTNLYVTMEPCIHFGLTPPCTRLIKRKGIKKVYYSFNDLDERTAKKSKKILYNDKIQAKKVLVNKFKDFYKSYFALKKNIFPYIDAKIAVSKDYYTINKNSKWITNLSSRNRGHLLRSQYDCIISTAKSINKDNSLLNCRLNGFDHSKPDLVIIDLKLKIKKNLNVFKLKDKRKITIITSKINSKKIPFFRNKGVKIDFINSLKNRSDFIVLFKILRKYDYNRIFLESGLSFLNTLVRNKLIFNLYVFQSSQKVGKFGKNPLGIYLKKKMNIRNKIKVNLQGDDLYKIKIN